MIGPWVREISESRDFFSVTSKKSKFCDLPNLTFFNKNESPKFIHKPTVSCIRLRTSVPIILIFRRGKHILFELKSICNVLSFYSV